MNTSLGYSKRTLDNTKVLLSGGGDKLLSDFIGSISWDAESKELKYTPVGGNETSLVTLGSNALSSTAYLPLSGGTLSNSNFGAQLTIERSGSANMAAIGFKNSSGTLGYLATNTVNGAFVRYNAAASASYTILDSSNSSVSLSGSTLTVKINGTSKSLTDTWNAMTGATSSANGTVGYVNAVPPKDGYNTKFLRADGTWSVPAYPTKSSWNYDDVYVKSVSISDNSLRINKNGVDEDLTIPFATSATTATIATKIKINTTNPDSETAYYLPFTNSVSGNTSVGANNGIIYYTLEGTTEDEGKAYLFIGNDVARGTAGNKKGLIRIYAGTAYYGQLKVANITENKKYILNEGGTVLTSGNYNSYALPLSGGTLTGNTNIDTDSTADARFGVTNTNASGTAIYLLAATNRGVYHSTAGWLITTNGTNSWLNIGNVGIGTDSPTYKLHVNGTANATTIYENGKSLASKYLALAGGTMNDKAVISRSCTSANVSWYQGRLYPIIKTTSYTGYNSILSMKTTNGSWDLGVYSSDTAYLTYIKDTDYNASTNTATYQLTFPKKTGTLAITDDIAWSNVSGKPSSYTPSSGSNYYLTRNSWWNVSDTHNANDLTSGIVFAYDASHHSNTATTGTLVAFSCQSNGNYALQLQGQYSGENLYFRNRNGDNGTWKAWRYVIHSGNIGSLSVNYATSAGNVTGTVAIANGGTGATTAAAARTNLSVPALISDSYPTLIAADGSTNNWIKIGTANGSYGLLPSQLGGYGSGHNYLGTSYWYWYAAYIDNINGYLYGTGATMTGSIIPNTDNAIDLGSSTKRWRYIYSYGMWGKSGAALRLGGNDATLMYLTSDAKCGIGTDSPSQKLHVSGGLVSVTCNSRTVTIGAQNSSCIHIYNDNNSTTFFNGGVSSSGNGSYDLGGTSYYWNVVYTNRIIAKATTDAAAGFANHVALITGDPAGLHLEFDGNEIMSKATGTTNGVLYLNAEGGNVVICEGAGNAGVGVTNPSYKLHVSGNAAATNFYTTSDRNKKQNISLFSEHIRKFQLKDTEKWHYGVIAQEVPEMFRDGEEGNMTVNYTSILSYYVGLLENKVASLEKELSILKQKLK